MIEVPVENMLPLHRRLLIYKKMLKKSVSLPLLQIYSFTTPRDVEWIANNFPTSPCQGEQSSSSDRLKWAPMGALVQTFSHQ